MAKHDGFLGAVYDAKGTEDVAALYDKWAESYDAEMAAAGYRHPSIALALLARHVPKGAAPLLDAGAGTGLIGQWLQIMGYPTVEALDISAGMLAVAKTKNCYSAFHMLGLYLLLMVNLPELFQPGFSPLGMWVLRDWMN
jgi:predicted TPR repeat methyltransferase